MMGICNYLGVVYFDIESENFKNRIMAMENPNVIKLDTASRRQLTHDYYSYAYIIRKHNV